jgi:hypothetical protein
MATPAVTPQAATAWDEQGNPVQPAQPAATGATAWDENGNPVQSADEDKGFFATVGSDIHKAGKGIMDFLTSSFNDKPTEGTVVDKALSAQWDSSMQAKGRMMDAAKEGDTLGVVQHAAGVIPVASQVDAAMTEYQKKPTHENLAHVVTTALPAFIPSLVRGAGKLMSGTGEAAEGAEATPKPGIVKQVIKGKNVAQPQAAEALSDAARGTETASLRESLTEPIKTSETNAGDLYKKIDDASGADFKALGKKLQATNRALRNSVDDAEETRLVERRDNIEQTIEDAKTKARTAGVDPKVLDQADAEFKKMSALTDVEKRVFKNVKIVKGNAARGTAETVDIDRAVEELQKLQDNEKYGAPRLEQAFGKEGASQLLEKFYDAQRQGVHAMKMQQVAKWVAKIAGGAAVLEGARAVLPGKE